MKMKPVDIYLLHLHYLLTEIFLEIRRIKMEMSNNTLSINFLHNRLDILTKLAEKISEALDRYASIRFN